jgi:hypothetical protein
MDAIAQLKMQGKHGWSGIRQQFNVNAGSTLQIHPSGGKVFSMKLEPGP